MGSFDFYSIHFDWFANRIQDHFPGRRMYRGRRSLVFDSPHRVIESICLLVYYDSVHISLLDIEVSLNEDDFTDPDEAAVQLVTDVARELTDVFEGRHTFNYPAYLFLPKAEQTWWRRLRLAGHKQLCSWEGPIS